MADPGAAAVAGPLANLHVHLEGALRWSTIRALHPDGPHLPAQPPWWSGPPFASWDDFIDVFVRYGRPIAVGAAHAARCAAELAEDQAAQGVLHLEPVISPPFWTGLATAQAVRVLVAGFARVPRLRVAPLLGIQRRWSIDAALAHLDAALAAVGADGRPLIRGISLQGDEREADTASFAPVFARAAAAGLRLHAHAGELAGADSVLAAVDALGATHIAHGVRAAESPSVLRRLAADGVYLHVCPTSNLRLGVTPDLAHHPLPTLLDAGVRCTLGDDDPLLFGCTLAGEYRLVAGWLGPAAADALAASSRAAAGLDAPPPPASDAIRHGS